MVCRLLFATLLLLSSAVGTHAATILIVNMDGINEGFNDPTPVAPVGGNAGTTIGAQRLIVFQQAATIWGALLPSTVTIHVEARFNALSCNATSAILGSAGPIEVIRDFPAAEFAGTWYHMALANKLEGVDQSPINNDIVATFNSSIDNNNNCLSGTNWYYGLDGNEQNDIELLPVVLHELAHGLGFSTLVNLSIGSEFGGPGPGARPDLYERFILDNTTSKHWHDMSNNERKNSAKNTGNVVWDGSTTTTTAPTFLSGEPVMIVNSPPALVDTIPVGTAEFGPSLTEVGLTGNVVLVDDSVGTTSDACEPIINGGQVSGNIALIDRGTCTFVAKAQAAQLAGASAVIIADNVAASTPIGLGGTDPGITIPVVSITLADGNAIKAELGGGVNVTLTLDATQLAGTDANNRVLLYAPNPLESGSSISHWDVSANPNLLMEPGISNSLSSTVDLTLAHFSDIGWLELPTSAVAENPHGSRALSLLTNYPNPFNPTTTIRYEVSPTQEVHLAIYDVRGRHVRSLYRGVQRAGFHETIWDGRGDSGSSVGSGVYYVRLAGEPGAETLKIVLLK